MATRPHEYESWKEDGITIDIRVFWRLDSDPEEVLQRLYESYLEMVHKLEARAK